MGSSIALPNIVAINRYEHDLVQEDGVLGSDIQCWKSICTWAELSLYECAQVCVLSDVVSSSCK